MKNFISYATSFAIFGLLIAGSIFSVGWALNIVEVVYWVLYAISFPVMTLVLVAALTGHDDVGKQVLDTHKWWHYITFVATIGLMFYAGLTALPIVGIVLRLYIAAIFYVIKEVSKGE